MKAACKSNPANVLKPVVMLAFVMLLTSLPGCINPDQFSTQLAIRNATDHVVDVEVSISMHPGESLHQGNYTIQPHGVSLGPKWNLEAGDYHVVARVRGQGLERNETLSGGPGIGRFSVEVYDDHIMIDEVQA